MDKVEDGGYKDGGVRGNMDACDCLFGFGWYKWNVLDIR